MNMKLKGLSMDNAKMMKVINKVELYLKPYGWARMNIAMAIDAFAKTHGEDKVDSLMRFIDWAEKNNQRPIVAPTLGHDLNACEDALASPRTSSY
jgi:hypothetical protein